MLRYFQYGPRNYRVDPDIPTQRFNWEFYVIFSGHIFPTPLPQRVPNAAAINFWVFPPNLQYYWHSQDPIIERVVFHFAHVPQLLKTAVDEEGPIARTLSRDQIARVWKLSAEIAQYYKKATPLSLLGYEKAVLELSMLALQGKAFPPQQTLSDLGKARVARAAAWYREHMADRPSLDDVAAATYLSGSHLRKQFHRETGASPSHTFLVLRMEKAAEILSSTSLTLEQTSRVCGFSSAVAFCRAFKKYYKTTAHVWRRTIGIRDAGKKAKPNSNSFQETKKTKK